ncbi:MAG: Uma2 family endonuclease [Planctomycetota bacterium]
MTTDSSSLALPRDQVGPADYDAQGRFLYPGDVEDAMPEGWLGWWLGVYLVQAIERLVADPSRASVCANMPIYYVEGEPGRHVSPDAFYLEGVAHQDERRSYCLWKTGVVPQVVFEVVSRGYEHKDVVRNRALYEQLGVAEYYWFDPDRALLMALRLDEASARFVPAVPGAAGRYASPTLGLEVGLHEGRLGLFHEGRYVEPEATLRRQLEDALTEAQRDLEQKDRALEQKDRELRAALDELERLRRERQAE